MKNVHGRSKTEGLPAPAVIGQDSAGIGDRHPTRPVFQVNPRYVMVLSMLVVVTVWEIWGRRINPLFASYPTAIAIQFWKLLWVGPLLPAFVESIKPFILGYGLAAGLGIPVGLLMGASQTVEAALKVYVWAGYSTPLVALVPLFILWFGLGFAVKVAVVFTLTLFPVVINTADGVTSVPKAWIEVGKAFAASRFMIVRGIILPATVPSIMTGLRLGVGRAVVAMVIAEFFTAISGLGGMILKAGNNFETAKMFVPILILMGLGAGLTALVGVLERLVAPWHAEFTGRDQK